MRAIDADALLEKFNRRADIMAVLTDEDLAKDFAFFCKLADAVEEMPTICGWISVNDRLPDEHDSLFANHPYLKKNMWAKESDNVIVYVRFPDGTGRSTEGKLQDGKWWTMISPALEPTVTHWMPLPEAPKGDDGDAR